MTTTETTEAVVGESAYFFEAWPADGPGDGAVVEGERVRLECLGFAAAEARSPATGPSEGFLYALEGTVRVAVDGRSLDLGPDGLVYVPAGAALEVAAGDDGARLLRATARGGPGGAPGGATEGALRADETTLSFDLGSLAEVEAAPNYSTAHGPVVEGDRLIAALMRLPAGTGGDLHTHPNEQFSYVLEGTNHSVVDGERAAVAPGMLRYVPPDTEHAGHAGDDADVVSFIVKDRRHHIGGTPVDSG